MKFKIVLTLLATVLAATYVIGQEGPPPEASEGDVEEDLKDYDEDDRFDGTNIHDALDRNPEAENNTVALLEKYGYPYEVHTVQTADGYVLTMFRITGSASSPPAPGKVPVLLMHGTLSSSADWIITGPPRSLAFQLADEGYDVWLGNQRGNTHSRKHISIDPKKSAFWEFSFHEIGLFDIPAKVDYILETTGMPKMHYAGHSQGTAVFFVMCALKPSYNDKFLSVHALSPISYLAHVRSPFLLSIAPFVWFYEWTWKMLGVRELFPAKKQMDKGGKNACERDAPFAFICYNVIFLLAGYNSEQLDKDLLPEIMEVTPAGASVNQILHFAQEVMSGHFRQYDYGIWMNQVKYGRLTPPDYDLKKITAPIALHYSDNDWLSGVKDVDRLANQLPNLIGKFRVGHPRWNHLDMIYALELKHYLNDRLVNLIKRYDD